MKIETIKLLGLLRRQAIRLKPHELATTIEGVQVTSSDILEMVKDVENEIKKEKVEA